MAWWFWILLWVALIALSLLYIGWLGVRLFRGFLRTLAELEDASARLSRLDPPVEDEPVRQAQPPAVFADPETVRAAYRQGKEDRRERRRERRAERKRRRGQPRSLRDLAPF